MLIELRSSLEAIQSNVNDIELCREVLGKLANLNVTEMSKDRVLVADLFYAALEAIQEIKGDYLENEVFDAFVNISQIAKPGEESASLILVNFLNDLYRHRNGVSSQINISVDETIVLLKDLEPIKFIFLLSDEDGERYFPASRLLSNIVLDPTFISSKIEPYHINLLQLAVEMYRITGGVNPQEQFEQLIHDCKLQFINYLDGTSIRVDTIDMANYRYNHVMVFYNEKEGKVLIRHENENYFSDLPDGIQINHEINAQRTIIGHWVELPVDGVAIDYSEAIKENPTELLELLYAKGCKNVLIEKMIIKNLDGKYGPLNPFCVNDKWVIKGQINKLDGKVCAREKIIECIDEGRLQMLSTSAHCEGINQISFGLCLYLLEKECVDVEKMLSTDAELECRQNTIIRNWVKLTTDNDDALEYVLRKWLDDLEYCNGDLLKNFAFEKRNIRDILPFVMSLKWVYELLDMPDEPSIFVGTISYEEEDTYYIDFLPRVNKSLAKNNHSEISGIYSTDVILTGDTEPEEIFRDQMIGYFMLKAGKWYFDASLQNVLKIVVNIELLNAYLIQQHVISAFVENKCHPIFSIMELHAEELLDVDVTKMDKVSMFRYRLLHNILYNHIDADTVDDYINIFLKHQQISFEGITRDKLFASDDRNTLIVPKDRLVEDAVLRKVYDRYIRKHSKRDDLWWYSQEGLSCVNKEFYRNGHRINVIRFLFDNTEHGTATIRTIAANIGKEQEWIDFEIMRTKRNEVELRKAIEKQLSTIQAYIIGENVVKPQNIYEANSPLIEIHSYFGTDEGDGLIKTFLEYCGIEKDNYSVSHSHNILYKADRIEKECENLGLDYEHNKNIYIVIREFNMTKKTLLPKGAVGDAKKVITLFVKKPERYASYTLGGTRTL